MLDVATGTGAVALELVRRYGCSVVGLDQSPEMLAEARRRLAAPRGDARRAARRGPRRGAAVRGRAFDALTFTYLLRYVDDPRRDAPRAGARRAARRDDRVARVRRPGGLARPAWELWVRVGLPARRPRALARLGARRLVPRRQHPRLLGARFPLDRQLALWRAAGIEDVAGAADVARRRGRHLGPPRVSRGAARLLRALARRLARLRHAAAPAVHALAPELRRDRRVPRADALRRAGSRSTLVAFALAMGVGAHALDELHGRPLQTRIPDRVLVALAAGLDRPAPPRSGSWARSRGRSGCSRSSPSGPSSSCAYNLEWFGGRFHTDLWFALAWGAFPLLTAYVAQAERLRAAACSPPRSRR